MLAKSATATIAVENQVFWNCRSAVAVAASDVASNRGFPVLLFSNKGKPGFSAIAESRPTNFTSVLLWSSRKHHLRGEEI
jgi:hypothetical protein